MDKTNALFFTFLLGCAACTNSQLPPESAGFADAGKIIPGLSGKIMPGLPTDGFDFPVGKPNAKGYYNAQKFQKNDHLGDDWNAVTGGNTDLGDPVYAVANGRVADANDYEGGWGNVIRIRHELPNGPYPVVESLYAHCDTILVTQGQVVRRGEKIGTIGTAHGIYWAHLHLELRWKPDMPLGGGYSTDTTGFLNPSGFINKNRPLK